MRNVLWCSALLVLAGCTDLMAPMPGDPVKMTPPVAYRAWYEVAEHCSGRSGSFDRVRWYRYDGARVPKGWGVGAEAEAATWPEQHKIAIAEPFLMDSTTVIHEALHDLVGNGHPAEYFGEGGKCSAVL